MGKYFKFLETIQKVENFADISFIWSSSHYNAIYFKPVLNQIDNPPDSFLWLFSKYYI